MPVREEGDNDNKVDTADPEVQTVRMLVVDDDPELGMALQDFFEMQGYEVVRAMDGQEALDRMGETPAFDIVLLDVMLPKKNGFEVLRESQERGFVVPVLMLTGRGEQESILQGFGLGAADYVVKPFDAGELAARVRAILGRAADKAATPDIFQVGELHVDFKAQRAFQGDEEVPLTELDFDLLRYLVQHRGITLTRKRLLQDVWGMDEDTLSFTVDHATVATTIDRHIAELRARIEPNPFQPVHLVTVYGLGYRFDG